MDDLILCYFLYIYSVLLFIDSVLLCLSVVLQLFREAKEISILHRDIQYGQIRAIVE